ncbi:hypothetical protein AURDEDRAFT_164796 [Auricularia subglabra TFB-10046 SS5]|nr:hypothetical protein AURDEDRAFT_164796 [Auricularia subglabra TFB-10046 SS5]
MPVNNSERNQDRPVYNFFNGAAPTEPSLPPYTPPAATPAPARRPRRKIISDARRSQFAELCGPCGCIIFFYFGIQACQAVWIYYYIRTCVHPNPRIAINSKHSMWSAYVAFMYIFGALDSMLNFVVAGAVGIQFLMFSFVDTLGKALSLVLAIIVPAIAAAFIVMPMFGGLIVLGPVQRHTYNHRCDEFRLQVVLDGAGYRDPRYVPDIAQFSLAGGRGGAPLFSYDLEQIEVDVWTFAFRTFDAPEDTIPPELVPTLRSVSYNFADSSINGTCATPGGNDTLCVTGTFNPGHHMSFDLFANTTGTRVHTPSRIVDREWAFTDDAPSLILRTVEDDGKLGDVILRTAVTKKGDCTKLKVCVDGDSDDDAGAVGASVLVPLGLILARQGDYAIHCTTPSD